ncbi:glycosyltransferase (plasmid) [Kitasatospora sp. NBC_00070]
MRITLVGPAHPWRGGIPLHTVELAHRLSAAGHVVRICSWRAQGPSRWLHTQRALLARPEAPPFPDSSYPLHWRNPLSWWWVGRRLARHSDAVVLVSYTTLQAPALRVVGARARRGARVVALCHNVLPHERHRADQWLTTRLLQVADAVLVHSAQQYATLTTLTSRPAAVAALPPHLPAGESLPRVDNRSQRGGLLFFGTVRHYKGLDVLLQALADVPQIRLSIVGDFVDGPEAVHALIDRLGLTERVTLRPGYLPADQIANVFATADASVLPYRTATASQHVALAHHHGVPVIATRVGNFPDAVRDGVGGLLCDPDDVDGLAEAIRCLYQPGQLDKLRATVRPADTETSWRHYLSVLDGLLQPTAPTSEIEGPS